MVKPVTIQEFFHLRQEVPVIDVRSPSEFQKAHIPGASNIPLFSDEERALVGTTYKERGKKKAIKMGLEIVGPKMLALAEEGERLAGSYKKLIVHCWRGGMRSENMAWLFSRLGIQTYVLQGGYKTYRRFGRELINKPLQLIIVGGMTGSGKTDILEQLESSGEQVLNLEKMANHKGSAFGAIGQQEQSATEQFENYIFEGLLAFDSSRTIWVEDESKYIGRNSIPDELFAQMRSSPVLKIFLPKEQRVKRLVTDYTQYGDILLKESIQKIGQRLGHVITNKALHAIDKKDYETAAGIILSYYDKTYDFGLSKRDPSTIHEVPLQKDHPAENAAVLKKIAEHLLRPHRADSHAG